MGENVVTVFGWLVTGEALCMQRLIAGFAVREVGESPAAGRSVFFRVFDHELNVHGGPSKRRGKAEAGKACSQGLVVRIRRVFIPVQHGNDPRTAESRRE